MELSKHEHDIQSVATEGLEGLFSGGNKNENQISDSDSLRESNEMHQVSLDSYVVLTAAEASSQLRIPISTIYRRIKAGKFNTATGDDGTVRIILPKDRENQPGQTDSHDSNERVEVILDDSHQIQGMSEFRSRNHQERDHHADNLLAIIEQKDKKLEAATYRVGYLEAQLANKSEQIKLLTDAQQKPRGAWARFLSWFMGGSP